MNIFGKIFGAYIVGGLLYVNYDERRKIKKANEKAEAARKNLEEIKKISASPMTYDEMEMNDNNGYQFLSRHYSRKPITLLPGAKEYMCEILSKYGNDVSKR